MKHVLARLALITALMVCVAPAVAQPRQAPGVKQQLDELAALVEHLRTSLEQTQTELKSTQEELASLKQNSVLSLDGILASTADSTGNPTVLLQGANLQIVNGTGSAESLNGLGNLIIGYNLASSAQIDRGGSHNLVLGDDQAYGGTATLVLSSIAADSDLSLNVGKSLQTTIGLNQVTVVGGSRSLTVGSDETISIGANRTESVGQNSVMAVGKNLAVTVAKEIEVQAGDEMRAVVGPASAVFKKDGSIQLKGKDIILDGSGEINVKAVGDVIIKGSKIQEN